MKATLTAALAVASLGLVASLADEPAPATEEMQNSPAVEQYYQRPVQADQSHETLVPFRATKLTHMAVQDKKGVTLASVNDLVIDWQNGRICYAVTATGGILGMGTAWHAIPTAALSPFPGTHDVFLLDISSERWASAPTLHRDRLAGLVGEEGVDVCQFYRMSSAMAHGTSMTPPGTPSPTGAEKAQPNQPTSLHMISSLIGHPVYNRQNEYLGKVTDFIVNWKADRSALALMSSGGVLKPGEHFAIPVRSLALGERDGRYVIDAAPSAFTDAAIFEMEKWAAEANPAGSMDVYRYPESKK